MVCVMLCRHAGCSPQTSILQVTARKTGETPMSVQVPAGCRKWPHRLRRVPCAASERDPAALIQVLVITNGVLQASQVCHTIEPDSKYTRYWFV